MERAGKLFAEFAKIRLTGNLFINVGKPFLFPVGLNPSFWAWKEVQPSLLCSVPFE